MKERSVSNGWFILVLILFVAALLGDSILLILLRSPESQPTVPISKPKNTIEFDTLIGGSTMTAEQCYDFVEKLISMEHDPEALLKTIREYYSKYAVNACERMDNYYIHCQNDGILPIDTDWLNKNQVRIVLHLHPYDSATAMGLLAGEGDQHALLWLYKRKSLTEYDDVIYDWFSHYIVKESPNHHNTYPLEKWPDNPSLLKYDSKTKLWYLKNNDK